MSTTLHSEIYLCHNIKMDRSYKNVLNYTAENLRSLCNTNRIASRNTYSFIKHGENRIMVDFSYSDCLSANYIAFQNYDYSNKWFFAFIDKVEYVNDGTSIINFTVDEWSTWFNDLTIKNCFVVREHVSDDTLGLHTIPEGLELGEYVVNDYGLDAVNTDVTIVTGSLILPTEVNLSNTPLRCNRYNNIPTPLCYCRWDDISELTTFLNNLSNQGKVDYLISMFLAPKWLCPLWDDPSNDGHIIDGIEGTSSSSVGKESVYLTRMATLDGYTPHNQKMLTYPYCYIGLSNAVGQFGVYRQENWLLQTTNNSATNNRMQIDMLGALTSGCSIRIIPVNYMKKVGEYLDESISLGKFPALAWANDLYTNWQTQNGVNILGLELTHSERSMIGDFTKAISGVLGNNMSNIGGGVGGMFDEMKQIYQNSMTPLGVRGSLNTADVLNGIHENCLHWYKMSIKSEYASIIDQFFDKYGYKVNTLKTPNLASRTYWNYIQIGASEVIGYGNIPQNSMDTLNKIFRNGTTVWHNHANIGNYSLSNTIVTP